MNFETKSVFVLFFVILTFGGCKDGKWPGTGDNNNLPAQTADLTVNLLARSPSGTECTGSGTIRLEPVPGKLTGTTGRDTVITSPFSWSGIASNGTCSTTYYTKGLKTGIWTIGEQIAPTGGMFVCQKLLNIGFNEVTFRSGDAAC